jgi:hypothetical protein
LAATNRGDGVVERLARDRDGGGCGAAPDVSCTGSRRCPRGVGHLWVPRGWARCCSAAIRWTQSNQRSMSTASQCGCRRRVEQKIVVTTTAAVTTTHDGRTPSKSAACSKDRGPPPSASMENSSEQPAGSPVTTSRLCSQIANLPGASGRRSGVAFGVASGGGGLVDTRAGTPACELVSSGDYLLRTRPAASVRSGAKCSAISALSSPTRRGWFRVLSARS